MKKSFKAALALFFCIAIVSATMVMSLAVGNISNLKATNVTYKSATISWTKASGADGYQVRPYTGGKWGTTVATTKTSYTASLKPGSSYYFYVRSYDRSLLGRYTYGSWQKVYVKAIPAQVTGLKATALSGGTSVKLTWNKVSSVTGYAVQQYKGGKYTNIKVVAGNTYTVTGLKAGTAQYFRVIAYAKYSGKNIWGTYSAAVKITPTYLAPAVLKVKNITPTSAYLYWSGSTGATGYQVYNATTGKSVNVTAKGATLTGLEPGTTYKVRVRGWTKPSGYILGTWSAYFSFQTAPAAVTNAKATDITGTSVELSWTASPGALGYQVYKYDYSTKQKTAVCATTATNRAVVDLSADSTYRFDIRPYIKNGSYYFGAWTYVYVDTSPVLAAGAATTETAIELTWDNVRNAYTYTVERYTPTEHDWVKLADVNTIDFTSKTNDNIGVKETYLDDTGASSGKLYRITAYNKNGAFINSVEKTLTTTDLSITQDAYSAKVTWDAPEDVVKYTVYKMPLKGYQTYSLYVQDFEIVNPKSNGYTFQLAPNEYHSYMIFATCSNGSGKSVATFTVKTDDLVINTTDSSKNSQLLMLVNAINKTKLYQDKVKVTSDSYAKMTLESIYFSGNIETGFGAIDKMIQGAEISGDDLVDFFELLVFFGIAEDGDIPETTTVEDPAPVTYTFNEGTATTETGTKLNLRTFLEPSGTANKLAYLYNQHNPSAWKNGFSSVETKYYPANGRYRVIATLKQEKFGETTSQEDALYHPGFSSIYNALGFSGTDVSNEYTHLGATKITAYIDEEGRVYNYAITSPFSTKFAASNGEDAGIGMKMSGTTTFNYKFVF